MNRYFFCLPLILLLLSAAPVNAQPIPKTPKWMSQKGYWVVKSNIKNVKSAVVYYYNNNHELVYQERITGKRMNINRKGICKRLEAVLVQSVTAWENGQPLLSKH